MWSASLMHSNAEHLARTLILLTAGALALASRYGGLRLLAAYSVCCVAGSLFWLLTVAVTGGYRISVGGSGAACGLLGAALALRAYDDCRWLAAVAVLAVGLSWGLGPVAAAHVGGWWPGTSSSGAWGRPSSCWHWLPSPPRWPPWAGLWCTRRLAPGATPLRLRLAGRCSARPVWGRRFCGSP